MIQKYVDRFMEKKSELEQIFSQQHPDDYEDIVKKTLALIGIGYDDYPEMNLSRFHTIDEGDYQGTLLFIIAAEGYQPSRFWAVKVGYGSCSGCDTLLAIKGYPSEGELPSKEQVDDYMTLALHIVQELKEI